jgi:redox-sensitive bicupin YhaK (pirin superfamily)
MQKKITHILAGRPKQIGPGETILQPLPHPEFRFANPFIVLHHLTPQTIAPGSKTRLPMHPHRGFSPVTFQLQGQGYHLDNAGNESIISAGDVQWMFAGRGIVHSEGPSPRLLEEGGTQELIQLWVNAPAAHKFDEPFYQFAPKDMLPPVLEQEGVHFRLASGGFDGKTGPLKSFTPVITIAGEMEKGRRVQLNAISGYWSLLYIASGALTVNCETVAEHQLIVFEKENEELILAAESPTRLLFLSAQPLDEPVAARDNFVMNTPQQIDEAIADYEHRRNGF